MPKTSSSAENWPTSEDPAPRSKCRPSRVMTMPVESMVSVGSIVGSAPLSNLPPTTATVSDAPVNPAVRRIRVSGIRRTSGLSKHTNGCSAAAIPWLAAAAKPRFVVLRTSRACTWGLSAAHWVTSSSLPSADSLSTATNWAGCGSDAARLSRQAGSTSAEFQVTTTTVTGSRPPGSATRDRDDKPESRHLFDSYVQVRNKLATDPLTAPDVYKRPNRGRGLANAIGLVREDEHEWRPSRKVSVAIGTDDWEPRRQVLADLQRRSLIDARPVEGETPKADVGLGEELAVVAGRQSPWARTFWGMLRKLVRPRAHDVDLPVWERSCDLVDMIDAHATVCSGGRRRVVAVGIQTPEVMTARWTRGRFRWG